MKDFRRGTEKWLAFHLQEISVGATPSCFSCPYLLFFNIFLLQYSCITIYVSFFSTAKCISYAYTYIYLLFSRSVVSNLFKTPMDCVACQAPLSMGILPGQEYWSGLPFPPLGGIPLTQESNLCFLHWQVGSLPLHQQGSPDLTISSPIFHITAHKPMKDSPEQIGGYNSCI